MDKVNHTVSGADLSASSGGQQVMQYTAGLKALLDVLPEDTDNISDETLDNYLWVIEVLLKGLYEGLQRRN